MTETTPPGWYPDSNITGQDRYWDGQQWTPQTRPTTATGAPMPPADARAQDPAAKAYATAQKNWFARHKVLSALGVVIVVVIVAAAAGGGGGKNTPAAVDSPAPGGATSAPASAAGAPAGQTLLNVTGNGQKQTEKFTASGDWDLFYRFDCTATGSSGNFIVEVMGSDGAMSLSNQGVNQLAAKGQDVTHEHNGGTYYLSVNSECAWAVKVVSA